LYRNRFEANAQVRPSSSFFFIAFSFFMMVLRFSAGSPCF
jgi:hypothetical protein